ncbi:MAG: hypothetical protein IT307_18085 [Chloroflexi bacterium]|nr:hypothetical protein [Chloroflexota bacterium]
MPCWSVAIQLSFVPRLVHPELLKHLSRPLLPTEPALSPEARCRVEGDVAAFLFAQIGSMPTYLRLPYEVALQLFNLLAAVPYGLPYQRLDASRQRRYLELWSSSPLRLGRDLIRLIRSCALLQFMDHPCVLARLAPELAEEHAAVQA